MTPDDWKPFIRSDKRVVVLMSDGKTARMWPIDARDVVKSGDGELVRESAPTLKPPEKLPPLWTRLMAWWSRTRGLTRRELANMHDDLAAETDAIQARILALEAVSTETAVRLDEVEESYAENDFVIAVEDRLNIAMANKADARHFCQTADQVNAVVQRIASLEKKKRRR